LKIKFLSELAARPRQGQMPRGYFSLYLKKGYPYKNAAIKRTLPPKIRFAFASLAALEKMDFRAAL